MATKREKQLNKQTDAAWRKSKQWDTFAKYEAAVKMIELQSIVRDVTAKVFKPVDNENGLVGVIVVILAFVFVVVVVLPALLASGQCANPNQCWHG